MAMCIILTILKEMNEMFKGCKHIKKIESLTTDKVRIGYYTYMSGNIQKEFYCLKCNRLVASVVIETRYKR